MGRIGSRTLTRRALFAGALAAYAQEKPPVFRTEVRLVRLLVTVKNEQGQLMAGLDRSAFRVFENGIEQQVSTFELHSAVPLSVSVLIDASGSTAKEIRYELDSVKTFLRALLREGNTDDAVSLFAFNYDVMQLRSFTRRLSSLERALGEFKSEGGTSLYDAIYFAAQGIEDRPGRHVIVIVTDGGDTTSSRKYHDALEAAHRADAVLYPVLVMPITNDAGRNIGGENALTTLSQSTGGRVFTPSLGASLDQAFKDILKDLRTQYLVGYYPRGVPLPKDRYHRIEVRIEPPNLRATTRTGYYGDAEQTPASVR